MAKRRKSFLIWIFVPYFVVIYLQFSSTKVEAQCDGQVLELTVGPEGRYIRYPDDKMEYGKNLECKWRVTSSVNKQILFKIFDVQIDCSDKLRVFDGPNDSSSEIRSLCTSGSPFSVTYLANNNIFIKFTSDSSSTAGEDIGFQMNMISAVATTVCKSTIGADNTLQSSVSAKTLTSLNFPNLYNKNSNCKYAITPSSNQHKVVVTVQFQDIDSASNTCYDMIKIQVDGDQSRTLCEQMSYNKVSFSSQPGKTITVQFTSDGLQEEYGFVMTYHESATTTSVKTTTATTVTTATSAVTKTDAPNVKVVATTAPSGTSVGSTSGTTMPSQGETLFKVTQASTQTENKSEIEEIVNSLEELFENRQILAIVFLFGLLSSV